MKRKLKHQLTSALLAFAVIGSSLLPGFTQTASAAGDGVEWDPLQEWQPQNGQSFDPVGDLLNRAMRGGAAQPSIGDSPVTNAPDVPAGQPPEDHVDPATGEIVLAEKDFSYPTLGPALEVARSYSGVHPDKSGMFGYGWSIPQERVLQMFDEFTITDFQADGSSENYLFQKSAPDEEVIVESYDGDDKIYYPLDLGSYTAENASNQKQLTRRGPHDYLLVDPENHMRYAFYGYKAPWRAGQHKAAGKLLRYADRTNFVIWLSYDDLGRITQMKGNLAPTLTFTYHGDTSLVATVTDYGGLQYQYDYDSSNNLTKITRPDGSTVEMTYDGSHRITSRSDSGVKLSYVYENGKVSIDNILIVSPRYHQEILNKSYHFGR